MKECFYSKSMLCLHLLYWYAKKKHDIAILKEDRNLY